MVEKKAKLVLSAVELVRLGEELEGAKQRLRSLVEQGVSYESEQMREALDRCMELKQQWAAMEQAHQDLRREVKQ